MISGIYNFEARGKKPDFLDAFEPWQLQYARARPPERVFYAGITGYGCFIGIRKMASISSGITEAELERTINGFWLFGAFRDELSL